MLRAPVIENQIVAHERPKIMVPMGKRWYVYGHTEIDAQGRKSPIIPIRKTISNWRSRSHISTVMTAADGSELVYGFPLDLDFEPALKCWKKRGKLDHKGIKSFIDKTYPILGRYLCTYTRSTGKKGLGLVLFFDPFLRAHEKTGRVNRLAESVQRLLITVLNFHGLGCDKNASGIVRFTPNWRNKKILLHMDELTIRRVQRDNEPHNVLRHVYNELRRSDAFKAPTRTDEVKGGRRFAVKASADIGLGKIYAHVLNSEPESLSLSTSYEELSKLSGLSAPTLRKYLSHAAWLGVTPSYGEGIQVKLIPNPELSERSLGDSREVMSNPLKAQSAEEWDLPEPEEVMDGDRNNYVWRKAVLLRNEGHTLSDAVSLIRELSERIPGAKSSRSCRSVESIVSSIYRHTRIVLKQKSKIFPLEALTKSQSYVPNTFLNVTKSHQYEVPATESQSYYPRQSPCEVLAVEHGNDGESKAENDKLLDMVSRKVDKHPQGQGGQGESPPDSNSKTSEPVMGNPAFLSWLNGIAPNALNRTAIDSKLGNDALSSNHMAEVIEMFEDESKSKMHEKIWTLREARAQNCREINPIDRFQKALYRCQGNAEMLIPVLMQEHEKLRRLKRLRQRYVAPDGRFKRVCEAFSFMAERAREEVLRVLKD
jgi:hypothetical protein